MSPATLHLRVADVAALAHGCDVLGSGGGGQTVAARRVLAHHLGGRVVEVVDEPEPGAYIAALGAFGSATVMLESLPTPVPFRAALRALEARHRRVDALLPLEVGGVNGVLAVLAAAHLGLPLIDADPMGRAFTEISRTALAAAVPLTSATLSGPLGHTVHVTAPDGPELERVLRATLPAIGGWGALAAFAGPAEEILPYAVSGSLTLAMRLGRALDAAVRGDGGARLEEAGVRTLTDAWVTEVVRQPGMEVRGVASLSSVSARRSGRRPGRVEFANEYVAAIVGGELAAASPDVICVVDAAWRPVPAEELRAGQHVRVLAVDPPEGLLRAHAASGAFGMRARGYHPVAEEDRW